MHKIKRLILLTLLIIISFGVIYTLFFKEQPNTLLELKGNVDIRTVHSAFRIGGRIQSLAVDEGDDVKQGDILAYLDNTPYQLQLQEAEAYYQVQLAQLQLMQKGTRAEEINQRLASVAARETQFQNAETTLKRQQKLAHSGATTDTTRDQAQMQFEQTQAELQIAKNALLIAQNPYRTEDYQKAHAQVAQAKAKVDQLQLQIQDTILVSPTTGVVLTRLLEPGSIVNAGTPILTLMVNDPIWVRAYVHEPQLGQIAPGTTVRVYTDSRVEPYLGTIGFVSPTAEFTPKHIETTELRTSLVYRFRVIITHPDAKLRQGMPVSIRL